MSAATSVVNAFEITSIEASSNVEMDSVVGNAMTTVDYTVAAVTLTAKGTDSDIDAGEENEIIGEFKLEETAASKKGAIVKSIRFKSTGGIDLEDNVSNIVLEQDGDVVSTETIVDGDYVTFKLADLVIADAKSLYFEIRADINSGDDADTLTFSVKDSFDIYAVEEGTSVGATIVKGGDLAEYTLNAGKFTVSQDNSTPSSEEYISDSDEVLAFVAKVDTDQEVLVDSMKLFFVGTTAANTVVGLNAEIENVKVYINDSLVDSVDALATADLPNSGDAYYDFDTAFTLSDDDMIKVYIDLTKDAVTGSKYSFKIDNAGTANGTSDSFADVEYTSDGETVATAKLTGTATSNDVEVVSAAAGATIVKNDGLAAGEIFLAGEKAIELMTFVVNAGNSSDLEIKKLNFDFADDAAAQIAFTSSDFTNVKLLKDGSQVGSTEDVTSGSVTIDSMDQILAKGSQATYSLVADIDNSATTTTEINVELDASESVFYDVNDNEITTLSDVSSENFDISDNAKLTVAVDGDTADSAIVLADTTGVEIAKYKFTATDGIVNIKDLYFRNIAAAADDSRISSIKLMVNGAVIDSRVPSAQNVHFDLGSNNQVVVPKNDDVVITITADFNKITSYTQTNKAITLELTDLVAETDATSNELAKIENAETNAGGDAGGLANAIVAIDNGDHYTTSDIVLDGLTIDSESMSIRKTQPTLATQDLGTTKLDNGEQTLYKFTVTADSKEDIDVAEIAFDVTLGDTDAAAVSVLALAGYKLYINGTDKTSDGSFTGDDFDFTDGKDAVISAGTSKTFELKATVSGAVSDDYVSVKILEDTSVATSTFAGVTGDNFVWSDNAGSPHSRTTNDWFNGYNVNGLDTTTTTLSN